MGMYAARLGHILRGLTERQNGRMVSDYPRRGSSTQCPCV